LSDNFMHIIPSWLCAGIKDVTFCKRLDLQSIILKLLVRAIRWKKKVRCEHTKQGVKIIRVFRQCY
jgi:hypothetical protein